MDASTQSNSGISYVDDNDIDNDDQSAEKQMLADHGNTSTSTFLPPSVSDAKIKSGQSYTYHSPIPSKILADPSNPVTLGVDEAGRGPVLGPMVYGVAYCPSAYEQSLTAKGYDDSKKLTTAIRTDLMEELCDGVSDTHSSVGWAVRIMSARDIAAGMLRPAGAGSYNLNAQAHDATIQLIQEVMKNGVNVQEIFVDTVGPPASYQAKLARFFPTCKVTVSKKADSLYPSVSVASVAAKVSRDFVLERYFELTSAKNKDGEETGSGYPSDPKTTAWLRQSMDSVFGWGPETRFSWSTAADLLKKDGKQVDWPEDDDEGNMNLASLMETTSKDMKYWYGKPLAASEI